MKATLFGAPAKNETLTWWCAATAAPAEALMMSSPAFFEVMFARATPLESVRQAATQLMVSKVDPFDVAKVTVVLGTGLLSPSRSANATWMAWLLSATCDG